MRRSKRVLSTVAVSAAALTLSGCGYEGLNSFSLPGTEGRGGYEVKVELDNAMDLVPNSPVLVNDLNAGSVKSIDLDGFQPVVTVQLRDDVELPANATAKIGQTSLLGAKHVEINHPEGVDPVGELGDNAVIALEQTDTYPSTEDVLASVSALLNGGGIAQIKTITTEMNRALGGRTDAVRTVLQEADTFTASLDAQKHDMTGAIDAMNRLGAEYSAGNDTIATALEALPPAIETLSAEREHLVRAFESMGEFGVEASDLVARAGDDLVSNIANLSPVVAGLAATADGSLSQYLNKTAGVFFPIEYYDQYFRGDFINLASTVDLGLDTLDVMLLTGTPLEGTLGGANGLLGQMLGGNSGLLGNPLKDILGSLNGAAPEPLDSTTVPDEQNSREGTDPSQLPLLPGGDAESSTGGIVELLSGLLGGGVR